MKQQGSYQIQSIASSPEAEVQRLKAQVELFWDKEFKHYREFGLEDGMNIVELGAGPGFMTELLLHHLPAAQITVVEIDDMLIDYARDHLSSRYAERCDLRLGSVTDTGLDADTYDFAIMRLVLEHLPDPAAAVRETLRILKPGGIAVFVDNDFEMHIMTSPEVPELRELYDAYCRSRSVEGGNPKIGRQLPQILVAGGFRNVDFEIIGAHSSLLGDDMFFKSEGIGIPQKLMRDGFLTSKALGEISLQWRNMLREQGHSIIRQLYLAAGQK